MSYLEKMSIQGIRSFGPDDKDKQLITFYMPLTLILGPNGTGKTTLIECMKYMTTGATPSGGSQKSTFIHDPKIARESSVKAQVRLQLRNVSGVQYVVQRAMSATQSAKTIKCTTLDGVITKKGADGRKESITTRCADIDREMVSLLGVGKPILENVIFCHQEDSCWPLSEGKALKQKFDDIFASTRYVKALDIINKNRKEIQIEIKTHQVEAKHLKTHKEVAEKLYRDFDDAKARCTASRESVQTIKNKLAPIEEKLRQIGEKEGNIHKLHTTKEKLKTEREQMELAVKEIIDKLENEFEGTTEELRNAIEEFETKVEGYEKVLRKDNRDRDRVVAEQTQENDEKARLLQARGRYEHEAQAFKESVESRDSLIRKTSADNNIKGYSGSLDEDDVERFIESMKKLCSDKKEEAGVRRAGFEKTEQKLQKKIDDETSKESAVNTEISIKKENMESNSRTIKESRMKLKRVEGSADRLSNINQELKQATQELEEHEKGIDLEAGRKEITKHTRRREELESSTRNLDSELTRMHSEAGVRTQLELHKKEKSTKDDQIRRLKAKNEDALEILFCDEIPTERYSEKVKRFNSSISADIRKENDQLQKYRLELSGKEQEKRSLSEELKKKKEEVKEYEDKIYKECGTQKFDEGIENMEADLATKRDQKAVLEGTKVVFDKYTEKLHKSRNPPCPLCHREFEASSEVEELINELRQQLEKIPTKLASVDKDISSLQSKFEKVLTMKPFKSTIANLREDTIPSLEKRVSAVEERITWLKEQISGKDVILDMKREEEERGNSLIPDMTKIDTYMMEIRDLERKIEAQADKLISADSTRTLQQVQEEKENAQEELDTVRRTIDRKQNKMRDQERKQSQLQSQLNQLTSEKLKIESDMQERKQVEDTLAELLEKNSTLASQIQDARDKLDPIKEKKTKLAREKESITDQKELVADEDKELIDSLLQQKREIEAYQGQIKHYLKKGKDKALDKCKEELEALDRKLTSLQKRIDDLDIKIKDTQKTLDSQKTRERELHDNLTLRNKQKEIDIRSKKITDLEEKLGDLDITNLSREKQRLHGEYDELTREKHQAEGREQSQIDEIRKLKENLRRDEYQGADEKYDQENILLRTKELAADDLEKYHRALDRTIMSYHKMKMDDINKIIRELWRKTYRGNDIETIEICHDEDTGGNQTRRTYNYRVVMIRNDVKLDLRGRCSAGQRVLASLIIRLALAETFCLNCGILALDEPTTNLDRENIESLAYALVEIIKGRGRQKNFQLIVITHDEDFVELLGRSEYIDKFWKVRKNEFGCSRLVEAAVADLGTR